jgi:hypothetical protein
MIDKYLKINSISPLLWGKSGWIFLNSIALTYNPENKNIYKKFFSCLPAILPCNSCGQNFNKNIIDLDIALESKLNLLNWLNNIRNSIYKDNGVPQLNKSLKDNFDEIFYKKDNYFYDYLLIIFSSIILVILISATLYIFKSGRENKN